MQWYKLSQEQINTLKEFQRIMAYLYELYYDKSYTKQRIEEFSQLISADLNKFPFLQSIYSDITKAIQEINKISPERLREVNQKLIDSQPQFGDFFDNLEKGIVTDFNVDDIGQLLEESKASGRPISDIVNHHLSNYIEKSSVSLFFSGGKKQGLLEHFSKEEWSELINTPIKKYSYLKFPQGNDAEEYIYLIQKLSDKGEKIKLHPEQFKEYLDFEYQGIIEWKKLKKLVDVYQHSNDKKSLVDAIKLMTKFPELIDYHNQLKAKYRVLYRGVGSNEDMSFQEIENEEKRRNTVATSTTRWSAENFAYGRGHLMGNVQSNDFAYLITYKVKPKDILLDTHLFGILYGEGEIIINSYTATIDSIEQLPDVEEKTELEYEDDDY